MAKKKSKPETVAVFDLTNEATRAAAERGYVEIPIANRQGVELVLPVSAPYTGHIAFATGRAAMLLETIFGRENSAYFFAGGVPVMDDDGNPTMTKGRTVLDKDGKAVTVGQMYLIEDPKPPSDDEVNALVLAIGQRYGWLGEPDSEMAQALETEKTRIDNMIGEFFELAGIELNERPEVEDPKP